MQPESDDVATRRRAAAIAGHQGDVDGARDALIDPAADVRATALGALLRLGDLQSADIAGGLSDPDGVVRRRACEVAAAHPATSAETRGLLLGRLADPDATVVEVAAWALGELTAAESAQSAESASESAESAESAEIAEIADPEVVETVVRALSETATSHADPLCREAAIASLGAIGHPAGLAAILQAGTDRPAVRRRAVLALAPFDGPEVDAALRAALADRDWQVRAAAEDLLDVAPGAGNSAISSDEHDP